MTTTSSTNFIAVALHLLRDQSLARLCPSCSEYWLAETANDEARPVKETCPDCLKDEAADKLFMIVNSEGEYLTRRGFSAPLTFIDNHNFACVIREDQVQAFVTEAQLQPGEYSLVEYQSKVAS